MTARKDGINNYKENIMYEQLQAANSTRLDFVQPESLRQKLESKRIYLERELSKVNEACAALDSNPEVSRIIESVTTVNLHY